MKTSYFLIAAAAIGLGAQSAAKADETPVSEQQAVAYHDLDLTSFEGVQALYDRITRAARDVCGKTSPWPIDAVAIVHQCRDDATARAVADVNAPMLTTYYAARR